MSIVNKASGSRFKEYPLLKDTKIEGIGTVPDHWSGSKVKHIADYLNGYAFKPSEWEDEGRPIIRIQNLTNSSTEPNYFKGEIDKRYLIRSGDILISWSASLGVHIWNDVDAWLNQHIFKATPKEGVIVHEYFVWCSRWFIEEMGKRTHGSTMQHVTKDAFGTFPVFLPPPNEQQAIVAFLDRETARIDEMIAKKQRLIELLEEKRTALISHAVTKGLNPDAPMKNSGIEWLGKIPKHWILKRLKNIALDIQTGPFGSQLHSEEYIDNGIPIVNPSNLQDGRIVPDWTCSVDEPTFHRLQRHRLTAGDIVFARRGEMGRCALVQDIEDGWLCGTGSLRLQLRKVDAFPPYVDTFLRTKGVKDWLLLESIGTTMDNLNTEILSRIPIPLPPVEEQINIIQNIENSSSAIDMMKQKNSEVILRLQEYRTALISAAVTGKIDVREEQA